MEIVIITGLSGAGKSSAMNSLEDLGYYCIDNLPFSLIFNFIELCKYNVEDMNKIALGIDIRGGAFFKDFSREIDTLREKGHHVKVMYIEASDQVLINRYKEHRRPHPLGENISLIESILHEKNVMEPIKKISDIIIDTSELKINDFIKMIKEKFDTEQSGKFNIVVNSFGFKKGIAIDSDIVFDVRFLPNPFYLPELRNKTGNEKEVQDYIMKFDDSKEFYGKVEDLIDYLIPKYIKEGKTQIVISFGCTGGRHRSVTLANKLGYHLSKKYDTFIRHRDL